MTRHEMIALRNIKYAINYIIGGIYNDMQDGNDEYLPESFKEVVDMVYDGAMNNLYAPGYEGYGKAPKEMRFSGKEFCRKKIEEILRKDSDLREIALYCLWSDIGYAVWAEVQDGENEPENACCVDNGYPCDKYDPAHMCEKCIVLKGDVQDREVIWDDDGEE